MAPHNEQHNRVLRPSTAAEEAKLRNIGFLIGLLGVGTLVGIGGPIVAEALEPVRTAVFESMTGIAELVNTLGR
jgi:hypothetical protein